MLVGLWALAAIIESPPDAGYELLGNGNVHYVEPNGPADKAGLQFGDHVLAVDGRPLQSRLRLHEGKSVGDTVALTLNRQETPLQLELTLGRVAVREHIFRIERLFVGIIFWLVGLVGWLFRPAQRSARLFLVFSQVSAVMLFGEVLDPDIPSMGIVTDLLRYLVAPLLLHFFATFPQPLSEPIRTRLLQTVYAGYAVLVVIFASALVLPIDLFETGIWILPRVFEVVVLVLALGVLLRRQPTASLDTQRRRRMLIAGMLLGIAPIMVTLASMVLAGGRPLIAYEWTLPAIALVPLAYGYAVYKGELGQADLILNRGLVYVILTGFLMSVYALLFFGIDASFSSDRGWGHLVSGVLLVVGGSTLFVPLRTRLQHWVDRLFYGGWYDYRTFVQSVSTELSRSTDLNHLTSQLQAAAETMRFQGGTLLWRRGERFYPVGSFGFRRALLLQFRLPFDGRIPRHLQQNPRPYTQNELRDAVGASGLTEKERALLDAAEITYWLPLVCRGTLRSILVTGPRQGDDELDREDRAILATMSTQAAIACENISLLQSLKERLTEVEQVRDELAEAQARLTEGREDERRHLSRELHDGPVQDLYAMLHELEALIHEDEDMSERVTRLRERVQRVAGALRDVCIDLRPPLLADFGLDVTIRSHVTRFNEKYPDLDVELDLMPRAVALPERVQLALFRICQEALNNTAQHGNARRVRVRFEADAERILLEIADDGCGFVVPDRWIELGRRGHLGLLGIAERAEAIGGTLDVDSAPRAGTTLRVTAPWPDDFESPTASLLSISI